FTSLMGACPTVSFSKSLPIRESARKLFTQLNQLTANNQKMTTHTTAELYDQYLLGNYAWTPISMVRGEGSRVWDDAGKCYLDFAGGIAVNALGHCHPKWVKRLQEQLATLTHCSNLFKHHGQGLLAKRLVEQVGAQGRVFFCNTGTEANEALLKLARLHGVSKAGKEGVCYKVICAEKAFHGRTFG